MTPNSRFTDFLNDIEPSSSTKTNSISAHSSVKDAILSDEELGHITDRVILGGSYRRNTAIRPRQKSGSIDRPDIDLYVVVNKSPDDTTPSAEIDRLYAALSRARDTLGISKINRNRVSLSVAMNKADLDISVLIERQSDRLYRIGNRETEEWYKTDPEMHTSWSSEQNDRFAGRFKPMTKLIKWARRENSTIYKHPKSFALEGFLAANLDESEVHYGKLLYAYCSNFVDVYEYYRQIGECPRIDDPAVYGANLLTGVEGSDFCAYYDKLTSHRDDAAIALEQEDQEVATTYWRRIFGSRFPAPKSANSSTLNSASTMSPLTFTNTPASPSKGPAKFAE